VAGRCRGAGIVARAGEAVTPDEAKIVVLCIVALVVIVFGEIAD